MDLEFKGTKGNWEIRHSGFSEFETKIICGEKRIAEAKHFNTGNGEFKNDPLKQEGRANAKLIAASPDLLEALQSLVEDTENCELNYNQRESVKKAKIAIEKALK